MKPNPPVTNTDSFGLAIRISLNSLGVNNAEPKIGSTTLSFLGDGHI